MGDPTGRELVRDRLRNGHDVIVVGRDGEAEGATGGAPKRARPNGADGGGSGGVRFAGAAGEGGGASASGAATASAGTVGGGLGCAALAQELLCTRKRARTDEVQGEGCRDTKGARDGATQHTANRWLTSTVHGQHCTGVALSSTQLAVVHPIVPGK